MLIVGIKTNKSVSLLNKSVRFARDERDFVKSWKRKQKRNKVAAGRITRRVNKIRVELVSNPVQKSGLLEVFDVPLLTLCAVNRFE